MPDGSYPHIFFSNNRGGGLDSNSSRRGYLFNANGNNAAISSRDETSATLATYVWQNVSFDTARLYATVNRNEMLPIYKDLVWWTGNAETPPADAPSASGETFIVPGSENYASNRDNIIEHGMVIGTASNPNIDLLNVAIINVTPICFEPARVTIKALGFLNTSMPGLPF